MGMNYIEQIETIKKWLKENLSEEKYLHSIGASETAKSLAVRFGENPEKAEIAALMHDIAKCLNYDELIKMIVDNSIEISDSERENPKTLHSPVGAYMAREKFGIEDQDIINSIKNHTLGRIEMSVLEKIVYLSDKIEPYTREEAYRNRIIKKLDETNNLDEAILICYESTIKHLLDKRFVIATQTIDVWNQLIANLNNSNC